MSSLPGFGPTVFAAALVLAVPLGAQSEPAPATAPPSQGEVHPAATAPAQTAEKPWYQRLAPES